MSRQVSHDVLRRMVSPPPPAPEDVPVTSSRAMRLAITRAADKTHQMIMNVIGLREETLPLDDMLAGMDPEQMLLAMLNNDHMVGVAALDLNLRAALIEVQTVGKVLSEVPDERSPTLTDSMMAEPLLNAVLRHMDETTRQTPLEGWGQGINVAGRVPSLRNVGLILPDRAYRVIRMTLDLDAADRQGELVFALPDMRVVEAVKDVPVESGDWSERFVATVNASSLRLNAELHRFKLPLFVADQLKVGQVLPLTGCKVTSLRLFAGDGRAVATARLGQSAGMRAVRIEKAVVPDMEDMTGLGETAPSELPDMSLDMASSPAAATLDDDMIFDTMPDAGADVVEPDVEGEAETPMPLSWDEENLSAEANDGAPEPATPAALDWSEDGV